MASQYYLQPNEAIILKETNVAHGGVTASYTNELILTNLNIVSIGRKRTGIFGNTEVIQQYPLNQIKRYNGKPQAIEGKLSNGSAVLEIYMMNGSSESFNFQSGNKKTIKKWIAEINKIMVGDSGDYSESYDDDYDPDTLVGAAREVGGQLKEMGTEFLGALGFKSGKKIFSGSKNDAPAPVSRKCISCSAPLVVTQGKIVKCKYCDTEQTL